MKKLLNVVAFLVVVGLSLMFFTQGDLSDTVITITPTPGNQVNQPTYGDLDQSEQRIADAAIGELLNAGRGVVPGNVTVLTVEEQMFSDTSLGCPEEGMSYTQVLTPGYIVLLQANAGVYEYHSDVDGSSVVECE